jgi:hypothetical protein
VAKPTAPEGGYPMKDDRIVGDGANLTVYERPDKSRYTLDSKGNGAECTTDLPTFGRARFDARELASGRWPDSRSSEQTPGDPVARARSHGRPKVR